MKHIIIEGGDCLGKNSLIEAICKHYNYNNIAIRHFDKPPKGLSPKETLEFQMQVFHKEFRFMEDSKEYLENDQYKYHDNIMIWNRSHLGEYVYSQMFRETLKKEIAEKLNKLEKIFVNENTFLISLTASPIFFHKREDGNSFSQSLDEKELELRLFREIHALSIIPNKILINVNKESKFRKRREIFDEVTEFLND